MYACAGRRNPRSTRYRFMPGIKNLPDHWDQQISTQQPDRHQAKKDSDDKCYWPSSVHLFAARLMRSVIANSRYEKEFEEFKERIQDQEVGRPLGVALSCRISLSRPQAASAQRSSVALLLELLELLLCYLLFANELGGPVSA